jgi:hypothetical protein
MTPDPRPDFDHECFLISPIGAEDSDVRRRADGVRDYIVKPAAEELGLTPVRADDIAQPGQITLQVIEHVLTAKAAVADLTGANPNVFYELAVRHTARLPVVLIAHDEDRDKLPFDIAQMRTVFYDHQDLKSAADCRTQIAAQLHEALEKGAVDSPVAASVNLAHLQGGNPSEQVLAQLVSTVEGIAADNGRIQRMMEAVIERSPSGLDRPHDVDALDAVVRGLERLEALAAERDDKELGALCRQLMGPAGYLTRHPGLMTERRRGAEGNVRSWPIGAPRKSPVIETLMSSRRVIPRQDPRPPTRSDLETKGRGRRPRAPRSG